MDPHREQGGEQQRHVVEEEPRRPADHDDDLGRLHEADDARLVHRIRKLPGKRGERKKGRMKSAPGNRVERRFLGLVVIDGVGDQDHHRRLVEIVVERAQELGDEKRQETPLRQEVHGILHEGQARAAWKRTDMRWRS
jgi:hypothetical protein